MNKQITKKIYKTKSFVPVGIALVKPDDQDLYGKLREWGWRPIDIFRKGMAELLKKGKKPEI